MIYKSSFKLDVRQLNLTRDQKGLLDHSKAKAAQQLGLKICETIPFALNEKASVKRELVLANDYFNEASLPYEQYDCEVFAVAGKDWVDFRNKLHWLLEEVTVMPEHVKSSIRDMIIRLENK